MVVASRNPVHSVLFLILAFFNAAGLFVLLGAEFLAMILVIVYVGAVAVLFLFVVMMLDINFVELRAGLHALSAGRRASIGAASCWPNCCWSSAAGCFAPRAPRRSPLAAPPDEVSNTEALGQDPLHRLRLPVPGLGADPAGRDDRRHRADPARARRACAARTSRRRSRARRADAIELREGFQPGQGRLMS